MASLDKKAKYQKNKKQPASNYHKLLAGFLVAVGIA